MKMHIDSGYTKDNTGNRVLMKGTKKMSRDDRARHSSVRDRKQVKKAKRRRKRIIVICEVVVLLVLIVVAFVMAKLNRIKGEEFDENNLLMGADLTGYTNIALFGLDARDTEKLGKGNHSDTIMVASINNDTKEVRLVSVYRDTYLNMTDNKYNKATQAYFLGGPEQAVSMLNMNLDLDIKDYITVNFQALVESIDMLGGIDLEITEEERGHLNNYIVETSKVTGIKSPDVEEAGEVHLNGVQAVSYGRIRYTAGDDYKRTERQRLVLSLMFDKAKKTDLITLNKIIDNCIDKVSTSLTTDEILTLAGSLLKYSIGDSTGFPFEKTTKIVGKAGDCVIPVNHVENVKKLHEMLFANETYTPSKTVVGIGNQIINDTGIQ